MITVLNAELSTPTTDSRSTYPSLVFLCVSVFPECMETFFPVGNNFFILFFILKLPKFLQCRSFTDLLSRLQGCKGLPALAGKGLAWEKKEKPLMLVKLSRTVHAIGNWEIF